MAECSNHDKDIIHCSICFDIFKIPKSLPCLHTFCQLCLQQYITSGFNEGKSSTKNQFSCPICREVVQAPDNLVDSQEWASKLPTNHLVVTLIDQEKFKSSEKSCDPCLLLEKYNKAYSWCTACSEALCSQCKKYHETNKMLRHHRLITIEEFASNTPLVSTEQFCEKHADKKLELFCVDHDEVCCLTCMAAAHRKCEQVHVLEDVAKDIRNDRDLEDLCKKLADLSHDFEQLLQNRKNNLTSTGIDKTKLSQEIKTLRQEINTHLDLMESQLQTELDTQHKETTMELEDDIRDLESGHGAVEECRKVLDVCKKHSENPHLFIEKKKVEKRYKELQSFLSSRVRGLKDIKYKLNVDEKAIAFKTQFTSLGKITVLTTASDTTLSGLTTQLPLRDCKAVKICSFNIQQRGTISGGVFVNDELLALVSYNYPAVLLYDCKGDFKQEIRLSENPFDIALVDKRHLVVTYSGKSNIEIIDIGLMKVIRTVSLGNKCRGITFYNGTIIVNCYPKLNFIDINGTTLGELTIEGDAYYITAFQEKIYCSYFSPYTVNCIDIKGKQIFRYSNSDLQNPVGLSTDSDGNLYVAGHRSHNIHQLTPDGQLIKIILNAANGIKHPRAVAFDKNNNRFFVVCDGLPVSVYKLEQ